MWGKSQEVAFQELTNCLTPAPLLVLPDFNKYFEIEWNASRTGIGGVAKQEGKPISEKIGGAQWNYHVYYKELYALVHVFESWQHYF